MKPYLTLLLLFGVIINYPVYSQTPQFDRVAFFQDTAVLNVALITNMDKLLSVHKQNAHPITGHFKVSFPDGSLIDNPVLLDIRGHYRMEHCYVPPIRLSFDYKDSSVFYSLKSIKLVNECKVAKSYEQFLLKEYLAYKIFNLFTDKSFRVRLINLSFQDSAGKKKPISEYAYLMEDIKELAKRNNCHVWKRGKRNTEETNRQQMTLIALFQYMIGNTDWAVSVNHNIKLIATNTDSNARPYAVPYDFDYSGIVNTDYAVPDERLEIETVRQRLYRGYARNLEELNETLKIFEEKKESIFALINNFSLLTPYSKKEMTDYLNEFYAEIKRPDQVKSIFIDNARTN